MSGYNHLTFRKNWFINQDCAYILGECNAYIKILRETPLKPQYRNRLLSVSLIRGAQATTAIEGNTLSEEDIQKINDGWKLPPSKEYLEIEVKNILEAFNSLLYAVTVEQESRVITPAFIRELHQMIAKNLGEHLDAIPGRFREDSRVVGRYRAPDYRHVPELIEKLCNWLGQEFHYVKGQNFTTAVIEAIIAHVYLEWIHPFGDGNGRTGRLLEFYILFRAGLPSIVSHVLSNFYNETRTEYYRQLGKAAQQGDLTGFIEYAVQGFRDGLKKNLEIIQESQFEIFWHNHIYEVFSGVKYTKKDAFKRKRELMLSFPVGREVFADEIPFLSTVTANLYARVKKSTLMRDLRELQNLGLIVKSGNKYLADVSVLSGAIPMRKKKNI